MNENIAVDRRITQKKLDSVSYFEIWKRWYRIRFPCVIVLKQITVVLSKVGLDFFKDLKI